MFDQEEVVNRRREIVRHWWHMKTAVPVILDRLSAHDDFALLDPTLTYRQKIKVIEEDVKAIRDEVFSSVNVTEIDAKEAHAEYISRLEYLYGQALQAGNLDLARTLARDSANAKGIVTDRPASIGAGDALTMIMEANRVGREQAMKRMGQAEAEPERVIDVTPPALPSPDGVLPPHGPPTIKTDPMSIVKKRTVH